jgi:dTDP-4-dehydrorhamnose reductase
MEFHFTAYENIEQQLLDIYETFKPEYIINCIGIINTYCKDNNPIGIEKAVRVNSMFPYMLSEVTALFLPNTKIIQIATDCVYDGEKGAYIESDKFTPKDVYGRTKSLGEVVNNNFLNIRTSIIGPEIKGFTSLLEWFLRTKENSVNGFTHHKWNGVTTLQFAHLCSEIILKDNFNEFRLKSPILHYVINSDLNKYELLMIFKQVFKTKHEINKVNSPLPSVDRTLRSELNIFTINKLEFAIQELYNYMLDSNLFNKSIKRND